MGYFKDIEKRVSYFEASLNVNLMPTLPIIMRFDGSSFSTFVQGLREPYDQRLTDLMIECCKYIVEYTNARCGFVGSDEITIVLWEDNPKSQTIYNGRVQKLLSELSSKISVRFNKLLPIYLPEKADKEPYFDAKIWNVPTLEDVANCFWVREESVYKNSITMACLGNKLYSSKQIEGVNGKLKQEMLFQKGINFNDYPADFKRGTYVQRRKEMKKFSAEEIEKLPLKHAARLNPDLEFERSVVKVLDMPIFSKVRNKVDVIIYGKDPVTE
jgi:tRNA(His) 5'-end guanylyltransferase